MFNYNGHMIYQHAVTRDIYHWLLCWYDLLWVCGSKEYVWLTMMFIWSPIIML